MKGDRGCSGHGRHARFGVATRFFVGDAAPIALPEDQVRPVVLEGFPGCRMGTVGTDQAADAIIAHLEDLRALPGGQNGRSSRESCRALNLHSTLLGRGLQEVFVDRVVQGVTGLAAVQRLEEMGVRGQSIRLGMAIKTGPGSPRRADDCQAGLNARPVADGTAGRGDAPLFCFSLARKGTGALILWFVDSRRPYLLRCGERSVDSSPSCSAVRRTQSPPP